MSVWHSSVSTSPIYHCQLEGPVKSMALSSSIQPVIVGISDYNLRIDVADDNGQWFCLKQKNFETKVCSFRNLFLLN